VGGRQRRVAAQENLDRRGEPAQLPGVVVPEEGRLERFISRATCCIQRLSAAWASTHTAAGLPANGLAVKASTWTMRTAK
jgi:hypothetical protein